MLKPALFLVFVTSIATCPAQQPDCPPTPKGYDGELWARAHALHHAALVADTHSDTTSRILDEDFDIGKAAKTGHMDLPRIRRGGLDVQFYSIYVASRYFGSEDMSSAKALSKSTPNASARRALAMIDGFYRTVARYPKQMQACLSVSDIQNAVAAGKHAALMGIEGGHAIEGDLRLLRMFHRLGVRYMTLTHSNHNHFADSSGQAAPRWNGLNDLGVKVVKEMNRLGMMVDVSHVSDATFEQVLKISRAPVILSHSSTRKLCKHPRNISDEMLRGLAKNGGVIMINFNCGFLDAAFGARQLGWRAKITQRERALRKRHPEGSAELKEALATLRRSTPPPPRPQIEILIDHICHALDVAGAEHVGLGSDFDGVPCVPKGVDDVAHLPRITYHLLKRGRPEAVVRKVLGGNLMRVFAKVEQVAKTLHAEQPHR